LTSLSDRDGKMALLQLDIVEGESSLSGGLHTSDGSEGYFEKKKI
jgi:hypothetical protein